MVILTIILVQVLCYYSITKITRNGINGAMFVTVTNSKYGNRVVDVVHGGAQFDQLDVRWRSKIEVSSIIIVGT